MHYGTNETAAKETVEAIAAAGGAAFVVRAEFGTDGAIDALYDGLVDGLDGAGLDILVNNAAIVDYADNIHDITPEQFDRLIAINVKAPLFLTQRVLPLIPHGGRIVNVSSGVTWFAQPEVTYGMTRHDPEPSAPASAYHSAPFAGAHPRRADVELLMTSRSTGRRCREPWTGEAADVAPGREVLVFLELGQPLPWGGRRTRSSDPPAPPPQHRPV